MSASGARLVRDTLNVPGLRTCARVALTAGSRGEGRYALGEPVDALSLAGDELAPFAGLPALA